MTQDSHARREAGFVHLRELLPDPRELAPLLPPHSTREGGLQGGEHLPEIPDNAFCNCRNAFGEEGEGREKGVWGKREDRGERGQAVESFECFADYLARRLRDEKSTAWYQLVVRAVPREVVQGALTRALDVPRRDIRRSRAALFTAIVKPHLPVRQPYRRNR
jgi:hypothetical protein